MPILKTLQKKQFTSRDIDAILGQWDHPALIWDAGSKKFISCNSRFIHFSRFSRVDLPRLSFQELFPETLSDADPSIPVDTIFLPKSRTAIPVRIQTAELDSSQRLKLFLFEEAQPEPDGNIETGSSAGQRWEMISALVKKVLDVQQQSSHASTEIEDILRLSQRLIGTDFAALYNSSPELDDALELTVNTGAIDMLPDILKLDDISPLDILYIWQLGEPPITLLHQSALAAQVSFLATAPLDPQNVQAGVLVMGAKSTIPHHEFAAKIDLVLTLLRAYQPGKDAEGDKRGPNVSGHRKQIEAIQQLKDQISDGIVLIDQDRNVIDINSSACDKLGFFKMEILHQPVEKVLVCEWGINQILDSTQGETPTTHNIGELEFQRRDGSALPVNVRVISLPGITDSPSVVLFSDLSAKKEYESRSRQLETQANLGEMMAVFAHEVRNPINNIRMGIENFGQYSISVPDFSAEVDRLLTDIDRISDLMKTILSAYRTKEYKTESFNLAALVETILFRWHSRMERHNIKIKTEIPRSILIQGDRNAVEQVFTNIIQNAINAMEESGGRLSVRMTDEVLENSVSVDIADSGPGIPPEIQNKIFNLYFTTKDTGNGIGLAFAKQIVDAHNGQISVASVPGGTVFRVSLPKTK